MEVKLKFNDINVKEEKEKTLVKILMLKGEKGDTVSAEWGTITGNVTDQTDLKNALDSKANQEETTQALNQKADTSDLNNYYTKNQMDTALGSKLGIEDIEDSLDSTSSEKVLSANQGKILKDQLDTKITSYVNVASMKSDTKLKEGDVVSTEGYYSANDGGGAEYLITDTISANDYQENLSNNLYATLIIKDYTTPEMFGAIGDGVNNDTQSIIKCFEYSKNIIAKKTYKCVFSSVEISNSFNLYGGGTFIIDKIAFNNKINFDNIEFNYDNTSSLGITLNGDNSHINSCIFDNKNNNARTNLLSIKANNVIIENSSFINNQAGRTAIMVVSSNNCIVKTCYFEKMGETAVTFMNSSKNCVADGNIAKDCSLIGNITDGVFSTYADFETGEYADNIGFINNIITGDDVKYCFRFDGLLNGYAKNNYVNIGDCKTVFRVQDRIDHETKLYTKNVDISDNSINVSSASTLQVVKISSAHDGLNVNINNNVVNANKGGYTSDFVEMSQDSAFSGKIKITNNIVNCNGYAIRYGSGVSTNVNYDILNNSIYYNGRMQLITSAIANLINNYLNSNVNHMVHIKDCSAIIVNNTLVNSSQMPDIYNQSVSATLLTPLDNTVVQIS